MLGLISGLVSDATAPLVASAGDFAARIVRKLVLFLVAGACLLVVVLCLTIAFDLWIATLAGPIVAALAVAGLYLAVAVAAVALALRGDGAESPAAPAADATGASRARHPETDARIDQFTAPLFAMLQRFGLRREQLAVFAGASLAKRLGPLPLVGCALVAGFLIARMWKSWRHLAEVALAGLPILADLLDRHAAPPASPPPSPDKPAPSAPPRDPEAAPARS